MKLQDVTKVTRQLVAEVMGSEYMEEHDYLEAIPEEKLVDVGKDITDTQATTERAVNSLIVLLARHEIDKSDFAPLFGDINVSRIEWGGFIERSKIGLADIMEDPMLNLDDGTSYADLEHTYYKPKVTTKLYDEGKGILIPISIQKAMLTEAFTSYDALNSFTSKILAVVKDTLDIAVDRYASALVSGAIAISIKGTETAVHLLTEAKAKGIIEDSVTSTEALADPNFLRFMSMRIANVRKKMRVMSTAYNNANLPMASGDQHMYILTDVETPMTALLKSGTFNRDDLSFGEYKDIPMWQAFKSNSGAKDFDFDTCATIKFSADPTNKLGIGTDAVTLENVVGVCMSKKAVGICLFKEYVTQSYTAVGDFWNNFTHLLTSQIIDSDYPIVAFVLD